VAESIVQVTEGSGKKLRTFQRVITPNTVEEEAMFLAEQNAPTYAWTTPGLSLAAAGDLMQIMAGASLNVYLRRILVYQHIAATTAAIAEFQLVRLTTAGTGGTAVNPLPLDSTDNAASSAGMTLPTARGTAGNRLWHGDAGLLQTMPTSGASLLLLDLDFDKLLRGKVPRIPAGVTNGLAFQLVSTHAGAQVIIAAYLAEQAF